MKISNNKVKVIIGVYEFSIHDTVFDKPSFIESSEIEINIEELNVYCDDNSILSYLKEDDTDTLNEIIDEYIKDNENEILKKINKEDFFSSFFKIKRYEKDESKIEQDEYENICYENKKMGEFLEKLGLTSDEITSYVINGSEEDINKMITCVKGL